MQEIVSTITSKGQITIPAVVRRHLGVGQRDKIAFILEEDGAVRLSVPRYLNRPEFDGDSGLP